MSFIAIILNFFIEHHNIFKSGKKWFSRLIYSYAQLFMQKEFTTVRQIRVTFILAMIPFAIVIGLMQFTSNQSFIMDLYDNQWYFIYFCG